MVDEVDKIITEFVVTGTDGAIEKAKKFNAQVEETKRLLIAMKKETGLPFKSLAEGLKQDNDAFARLGISATQSGKVANTAVSQLNQGINTTTKSVTALGRAIQIALGISFFQIFSKIINYFQDAAKAGLEFAKSMYALEIAVRAQRRAGMDLTTQEMYENIDKLQKKFKVFAFVDLVKGQAEFANLTRDLSLTKDQFFKLSEAMMTLSIINSRPIEEVQKTVALLLSSGYSEGVQRLGVSINRVTIALRAQQLGFSANFMSLTEYQKAQASTSLLLEKITKYDQDIIEYYKTETGQIDTLKAGLTDIAAITGKEILPLTKMWYEILTFLGKGAQYLVGIWAFFIKEIEYSIELLQNIDLSNLDKTQQVFKDISTKMGTVYYDLAKGMMTGDFTNFGNKFFSEGLGLGVSDKEIAATQKREQLVDEMNKAILNSQKEFISQSKKAQLDYIRDQIKIDEDGQKKRIELYFKYQDDLAKIKQDAERQAQENARSHKDNLSKIDRNVLYDLSELAIKYEEDRAKIFAEGIESENEQAAKARERELKEERDYQEKLLKLREDFEMSLEDAVRERDARQIMQLSRRYALQQKQLEREHGNNLIDIRTTNEKELQEIIDQRAKKLQLLAEEYASRQAEIERSRQREISEENIRYQLEKDTLAAHLKEQLADRVVQYGLDKAELDKSIQEQKTARDAQYAQDLADLKTANAERLDETLNALITEQQTTAEQLDLIGQEYELLYGKDGRIDRALQYYRSQLAASGLGGGAFMPFAGVEPTGPISTMPDLFSSPNTSGLFSSNQAGSSFSNPITSGQQSVVIAVDLSPDLVGRIQQNTLDQVAEILVRSGRRNAR